jgi:hypothetical protein
MMVVPVVATRKIVVVVVAVEESIRETSLG